MQIPIARLVATEMDEKETLLAEFEYWLNREGIALPAERRTGALADFADVRKHVGIVNNTSQSNPEPSTVFVLRSGTFPS